MEQLKGRHSLEMVGGRRIDRKAKDSTPGDLELQLYAQELEGMELTPYQQRVVQLYGAGMIKRFGRLKVVTKDLLQLRYLGRRGSNGRAKILVQCWVAV